MSFSSLSNTGRSLLDRRRFLASASGGLTGVALASLLSQEGRLSAAVPASDTISSVRPRTPHFAPRAQRVLMIFCSGACSQVDTWDYKPELIRHDGKPMPGGEDLVTFQGKLGNLTKSPWKFRPRGECGKFTSDLLPQMGELVDDFCFIHSMTSKTNTHGPGETFMSTGFTDEGYPSAGAWISYALGSEADDLPAYVAIPDPRGVPQAGPQNWGNGFLPAAFQGTAFNADRPIGNLAPPSGISSSTDRATRSFVNFLNERHLERHAGDTDLAARIASYELAAKLQLSAPQVADLSQESASMHALYGTDHQDPVKSGFARNCLLARRLLERGVRCVQIFNGAYAMGEGVGNWDGHKALKQQYDIHGPILDSPAAALIKDLKARGMMRDTLVMWVTEFGRTPMFQVGANGRDHNPKGFTVWLAGAGVKAPFSYGATDEFGYQAVQNPTTVWELYATVLHLLGLDFNQLSYRYNGADQRLTFVNGRVVKDILL